MMDSFSFTLHSIQEPTHGRTLLHEAACAGNLRTAAILLRYGADSNATDLHGRPALGPLELNVCWER